MRVKDVMRRTVETVSPETSLKDTSERLQELDASLFPVQSGSQVVGVISAHDITVRALAHGLDPSTTEVGEVMTHGALSCYEDEAPGVAARKMAIYGLRHLIVLNRAQRPVGIVSLEDVAAESDDSAEEGEGRVARSAHAGHTPGFRQILVALDGSHFAERILPSVESLAGLFGATVTLLQAVAPHSSPASAELSQGVVTEDWSGSEDGPVAADVPAHARAYLGNLSDALKERGLTVESECVPGEPSQVILRRARELGVDLVAITTHGRTGVDRVIFGSVAEEVLRHAPCPVLLVRVHDARPEGRMSGDVSEFAAVRPG